MSNHSGSDMLNDLLKLMDQEHRFDGLGMEKTQSLIRKCVGMAQAYDCNGGESLEHLTDRFQLCYSCLAKTQDLNDGLCPRCRRAVD
jgi:hypothetical protein